jgi:hypothetical protein
MRRAGEGIDSRHDDHAKEKVSSDGRVSSKKAKSTTAIEKRQ